MTATGPLRVAVTGTPGTGKTTATDRLLDRVDAGDFDDLDAPGTDGLGVDSVDVVHLNDVVQSEALYDDVDEDRGSVVVDLDALAAWVDEYVAAADADVVVFDSHLAHHLDADRVVVLRCHPETLDDRLTDRGEPAAKAAENAESEALDVVLGESVDAHGTDSVYEIATTDREPDDVAAAIAAVLVGDREPSAGTVDYIEYL
ncbi:adenylate kinase family protein [Halorubellus sp. PRR65]|uniref:adenylate kinase family protein n=1 Tax=Halorubellus sp. PRR65 TaxID=3098148 RepID=UPI002B259267|nr:adenylate kinase family protein [Halorubellus sp. PRR65]